jgi:Zn-dependent oligopeptidase
MVEKLEKSTKANAGAINLRQVVLALFDQTVHTGSRCDTAKVYEDTVREILDMDTIPNTNFAATFNHLAHGYSARYYSYLVINYKLH